MLQEPRYTDERPDETNAALMSFCQASKTFIALDIPRRHGRFAHAMRCHFRQVS